MKSSFPTRVIAVVAVVAVVALFAAPVQAAGAPSVARSGAFTWLNHSLVDWVSALFGIDVTHVASPKAEPGVRSMTEKINNNLDPDGAKTFSSVATFSPTLSSQGTP